MRNAPSLRNVIAKQFCQFLTCFLCDRISPGSKRHQKLIFCIKCHITMHHTAESDRTDRFYLYIIFFFYISDQIRITALQSFPDSIQTVGPDMIYKLILPIIITDRNDLILFICENCLDSGRAKLNTKSCFTISDFFLRNLTVQSHINPHFCALPALNEFVSNVPLLRYENPFRHTLCLIA